MQATIHINGLEAAVILGVFDHERQNSQPIIVHLQLRYEVRIAQDSDDIQEAICYAEVCDFVCKFLAQQRSKLLETLAGNLQAALRQRFLAITGLRLLIEKPQALQQARISLEMCWPNE